MAAAIVVTGTAANTKCGAERSARAGEVDQEVVSRRIGDPRQAEPAPQQEGVADDLRLLLDAVPFELPAWLEAVIVAAPGMAVQDQVPVAPALGLPNVRHLMDEQPLAIRPHGGEIVAISVAKRMKMKVPARRHRDATRLKRKELAAADRHLRVVDGTAEHASGEGDFPLAEPALAPDRAGERRLRHRHSTIIDRRPPR